MPVVLWDYSNEQEMVCVEGVCVSVASPPTWCGKCTRNPQSIKSWEGKTVTKYQNRDFLHSRAVEDPFLFHFMKSVCLLFFESGLLWQLNSGSKPSTFIHFPNALRSERCACLHSLVLQTQLTLLLKTGMCHNFPRFRCTPSHKTKQRRCPPGITPGMSSFSQTQRLLAVSCKHSSPSCFWWFLTKFIMRNEDRKLQDETALQHSWIQKKS